MNKKLIVLAVAGMALPMAAQAADVSLTGRVQAAYTDLSVDNNTAKDFTKIQDDFGQSRFGFNASADAGGGMKIFARSEWKFDPTDVEGQPGKGTAEWQTRDQYVGMKGGFGTVKLGTQTSPYKVAGGVKIDPWTATAIEGRSKGAAMNTKGGLARANMTGMAQSGHIAQTISYTTPKLGGGVSIGAAYHVNGGDDATSQAQGRDGSYSVAVNWKTKGLWVFAATSSDQCAVIAGTTCTDASITKIGAQWKSGAHTIAGQYEAADKFMTTATNNGDGDYMFLNYQFKMGKNILTASYGTFDGDNAADLDVDYMSVGAIHKFTKKTRAFIGYRASDEDGVGAADNSETALSAGMRFDF